MKSIKLLFNIFVLAALMIIRTDCTYAKTLNFAIASDVHYSAQDFTDSDRDISKAPKALKGFVDRVNENKYDFVIFLGDSIDKSNEKNLLGFLKAVKPIKTPYYLVMGNHDVHKISGMEKKKYLEIVSKHNKHQKKAKGSYYFCPNSDIAVIVLDSVSSGMPSAHGIFTQTTLSWLDDVLAKNKNKKVIIFQHVPYFTPYSNPSHEILEKTDYRAVINRHDNILAIISGHYHKAAVKKDDKGVYHICTPALYLPPYYYTNIKVEYDKKPFERAENFKIDGAELPAI